MKYAFIDTHRSVHDVRTLCKALRVSPSGYYAARSRPPSTRTQRQSALVIQIREAHVASRQSYGAPRVHAELTAQGVVCCRNTVAKLMHREHIVPRAIRKFRVTTDSRNTKEVSPDWVRRRFKAKRPNALMHLLEEYSYYSLITRGNNMNAFLSKNNLKPIAEY